MNPAPMQPLTRAASVPSLAKTARSARLSPRPLGSCSKLEEPYPEGMPELSRFFGIVIGIFYREHGRPHFHAVYAEFEAVIDIETGEVISGELPKRALNLVSEWRSEHVAELREDWELARQRQSLKKIPPLE